MHALRTSTFIALISLVSTPAHTADSAKTTTFAVTRNDARIGTSTICVEEAGSRTTIASTTHVAVKLAFLTLYHFDQTETEQWASGQWQSMSSTTDDNGIIHRIVASSSQNDIIVQGDGREKRITASVVPASLWNEAVLTQNAALDPLNGRIVPVRVVDRGEEDIAIDGRSVRARHFEVTTGFSQDVWYDPNHQLVQMELKGHDGSVIRYQRV